MAESRPDPDSPDPFADTSDEAPDPPAWGDAPEDEQGASSFATDMARLWVRRHQKASMLGAFAVGVFVGAMLRD